LVDNFFPVRLPIVLWLLCSLSLLAADEKKPCVFCEIAAGRLDANRVVYRDETVVAFVNRAPRNPGHVLVVPIQHADGILDAPPATVRHLFEVAQVIAKAIQRTDLKAEGFVLKSSTGAVAGQTVFHLHLHGIPRFKGETPEPLPGQELPIAPAAELDAVAAKIRAALGSLNR
jgi:diadenosine tetraphosphate (Ap4A) HIT family hydrolase